MRRGPGHSLMSPSHGRRGDQDLRQRTAAFTVTPTEVAKDGGAEGRGEEAPATGVVEPLSTGKIPGAIIMLCSATSLSLRLGTIW